MEKCDDFSKDTSLFTHEFSHYGKNKHISVVQQATLISNCKQYIIKHVTYYGPVVLDGKHDDMKRTESNTEKYESSEKHTDIYSFFGVYNMTK